MERKDFLKQLANGINGVFIFEGNEEYLKESTLAKVEKKLLAEGFEALNETILEEPNIDRIYESALAMPFMCDQRLVIAKDPPFIRKRRRKAKESKGQENGEQAVTSEGGQVDATDEEGSDEDFDASEIVSKLNFLNSDNPSCVVILYLRRGFERVKLRNLQIENKVISFDFLSEGALVGEIKNEFKQFNSTIQNDAAIELARYTGGNMTQIMLEINKLSSYKGDGSTISIADVWALVSPDLETSIFKMLDFLLTGDYSAAYDMLNTMLQNGEKRMMILYMITRQLRLLYYVKTMVEQHTPVYEIQKRLELKNDYQIGIANRQAKPYKAEKLLELYSRGVEYEESVKTGKIGEQEALDCILTLLSKR